jgi:hypothetical protein
MAEEIRWSIVVERRYSINGSRHTPAYTPLFLIDLSITTVETYVIRFRVSFRICLLIYRVYYSENPRDNEPLQLLRSVLP